MLHAGTCGGYENRVSEIMTFLYPKEVDRRIKWEGVLEISQQSFVVNQEQWWLRYGANLGLCYQKINSASGGSAYDIDGIVKVNDLAVQKN